MTSQHKQPQHQVKNKTNGLRGQRSLRRSGGFPIISILMLGFITGFVMISANGRDFHRNEAYADVVPVTYEDVEVVPSAAALKAPVDSEYRVQAVLSAKRRAVISSAIDGKLAKFSINNGQTFKSGDILVEYDCGVDYARLKEAQSRQRLTQTQLDAYKKLHEMKSIADVELIVAQENNEQNLAIVQQVQGRLKFCKIKAPFDGRVTNKMASQYEFAQTGRVLMDVVSNDPLQAEFLIPSKWLRWLNINTALTIYIGESDRRYLAKIVAVHGEVDPVSQSVQVVAEMESYHEELLPGMSGQATFDSSAADDKSDRGFLGLVLNAGEADSNAPAKTTE